MRPPPFDYFAPTTVAEVVSLLAQHGSDSRVIAGGQSLVPLLNLRMIRPAVLIDLNRCPELSYIEQRGSQIAFGPMTRQIDGAKSATARQHCPLVSQALELTGPVAVRCRSTVGGTLAHADRVAELPAVAVALGATMVIEGPKGKREVAAQDFFLGDLSTAVEANEFLRETRFPACVPKSFSNFSEVGVRQEGVAVVGLAVYLVNDGARVRTASLAAMGVDAAPVRLRAAEGALQNETITDRLIDEVASIAAGEIDPMPDIYTTAAYRKHAVSALLKRALQTASGRSTREH